MRGLILLLLLPMAVLAQNVKTYIPPQAFKYFDTIKTEQIKLMPDFTYPEYFPGLFEHESCLSLTHSKCWNVASRLKTKWDNGNNREEGAGLIQITRAYKKDGSVRFDTLTELRRQHYNELRDLSWDNVYTSPELQIRAGIILVRDNYNKLYDIDDPFQRMIMADPAYNGGFGGLTKERMACGLAVNCNPNIWFGNVERYCLKSREAMYGGRSACDINRHHVDDVIHNRMPKYYKHFH